MNNKILLIKLGALGDFVQATPFFKVLRKIYPKAPLTLLTRPAFIPFAKKLKIFDSFIIEERYPFYQLKNYYFFFKKLNQYDQIIDLQGVDRTRLYSFFAPSPSWVFYDKLLKHPRERFQNILHKIGISDPLPLLDLTSLGEPLSYPPPYLYVLIVPGASSSKKCWPEENYLEICQFLISKKITPIIIGKETKEDFPLLVQQSGVFSLLGKTTWWEIIGLAKNALLTIGNDTGPVLLAASGGSSTFTLYTSSHGPDKGGARGEDHYHLIAENIKMLSSSYVVDVLNKLLFKIS